MQHLQRLTVDELTDLAFNRLRAGDYAAGFRLYEGREVRLTPAGRPQLPFPYWRGEPVGSLLILPEQGYGDQIMMARYVPGLVASGVRVALGCRPPLARLFAHLGVEVLPLGQGAAHLPPCDAWTLPFSLPTWTGTTLGNIPPAAYLPSSPEGAGIGVVTSGSPDHPKDAERSLPAGLAEALLALPGARSLDPSATGARDFEDTREIIAGQDLVIAVDTAVAHLAGSMGKPVWVLLPFDSDWRWGIGGTTPWYPTARLIRQPTSGDWAAVVAAVRESLIR